MIRTLTLERGRIKACYLEASSAAAERFLAWFERVFGVMAGR